MRRRAGRGGALRGWASVVRRSLAASLLGSWFAISSGAPLAPPAIAQSLPSQRLELGSASLQPRIVNGVQAAAMYPPVGLMLRLDAGALCTGTLIGCHTFLTAAHCVTPDFVPGATLVFFPHHGFVLVSSAVMSPDFEVGVRSDVALVTLASDVTGIEPATLNNVLGLPSFGTPVVLVGFGAIGDIDPMNAGTRPGILRRGSAVTAPCVVRPDSSNVCFWFEDPLGPAGTDSGTCFGDSGGPMFASIGGLGTAVAGVASGITSANCLPFSVPFHSAVDFDYAWIAEEAAGDLAPIQCSDLATALSPAGPAIGLAATLGSGDAEATTALALGAGFSELRITTNGELAPAQNYDLYVKYGSPPVVGPTPDFDCRSNGVTTLEACEFASPAAGDYFILVHNPSGSSGELQLTMTGLGTVPTWTPTLTPTTSSTPTQTPTPSITMTPTATLTATATATSSATATPTRSSTPTATSSATLTATPSLTPTGLPCSGFDADGNGSITALTDGLLALRHLFGLTGTALASGALGAGATRDAAAVVAHLNACSAPLDVDGNGVRAALTDGLLVVRYLFGLRDAALVAGAVGGGCTRCLADQIEDHIAAQL